MRPEAFEHDLDEVLQQLYFKKLSLKIILKIFITWTKSCMTKTKLIKKQILRLKIKNRDFSTL